jgi:hypothetical protein
MEAQKYTLFYKGSLVNIIGEMEDEYSWIWSVVMRGGNTAPDYLTFPGMGVDQAFAYFEDNFSINVDYYVRGWLWSFRNLEKGYEDDLKRIEESLAGVIRRTVEGGYGKNMGQMLLRHPTGDGSTQTIIRFRESGILSFESKGGKRGSLKLDLRDLFLYPITFREKYAKAYFNMHI